MLQPASLLMASKWALVNVDNTTSNHHAIEPTQANITINITTMPQPAPNETNVTNTATIAKQASHPRTPSSRPKYGDAQYLCVLEEDQDIICFRSSTSRESSWRSLGRTWTCRWATPNRVQYGKGHLYEWVDDLIQDGNSHHYVGREGDGGETWLFRIDLRGAMAHVAHIAQVVQRANEWCGEE